MAQKQPGYVYILTNLSKKELKDLLVYIKENF